MVYCGENLLEETFENSQCFSESLVQGSLEKPFSLEDIAKKLKIVFQGEFSKVWIQGEVSSFMVHGSGHRYFSLKDGQYLLDSVSWKTFSLDFLPKVGETVTCYGSLVPYGQRSKYQFVVENIRPLGLGSIMMDIQRRKEKLMAEGLFDKKHKKPLPSFPEHIGVLTSAQGAVLQDIHVQWQQRFPSRLTLYPIAVQGEACVPSIIKALDFIDGLLPEDPRKPNVLILARGGGSFEDLLPFQDEALVRHVFSCSLPIVSAIGHESDHSLVDLVSTLRAPTPTAAIASLLPTMKECKDNIYQRESTLYYLFQRDLSRTQEQFHELYRRLIQEKDFLEYRAQFLDDLWEKYSFSLKKWLFHREQPLMLTTALLMGISRQNFSLEEQKIHELWSKCGVFFAEKISRCHEGVGSLYRTLYGLSPQNTLDRGFFMVSQGDIFVKKLEDIQDIFTLHGSEDKRNAQLLK